MTPTKLIGFLTALSGFSLLTGCSDDDADGIVCTTNIVYGLTVDVEGGASSEKCDYTVTATEGKYVEALQCDVFAGDTTCHCYGAKERAGMYHVEVASGEEVLASRDVTVSGDECHVETQRLSFSAP
ncbi:MAG: hypothetical protein QM784_30850 [Polyangiaceae bacterium]